MTNKIQIDISDDSNNFILFGSAISELLLIRAVRIYLKDSLRVVPISKDRIEIPYEIENQELILQKIRDLVKKFGFDEKISLKVRVILNNYFIEDQNFMVFSKEAYLIRNNQLLAQQIHEFECFTEALDINLTNRKLYPLQLLAAYHLAFSQNACNFSVPGSGKTSIVYAAYTYLNNLEDNHPKYVDKLLIIGPLSSFSPWENEYVECFGKNPSSKRLSGGVIKSERIAHFYSSTPSEISLLSYNSIPNLEKDLVLFLKKYKVMVVLDEAHKIKNISGGIIAESVLRLAKYCKARVVLTGTPAPNGYEDLFNLNKFIWPTKNIIPFHLSQLKEMSENPGDTRVKTLIDSVSPYFIRIRKSDLNIPKPIDHEPNYVSMGNIQREIYDYIEKNYMDYFESASHSDSLKSKLAQARLVRLMQASTNPALLKKPIIDYFEDEISETFVDDSSVLSKILTYNTLEIPSKFIKAKQMIKQIISKGEKVVVWAIFIQTLEDFQKYLSMEGINSEIIYGSTPIEKDDLDPLIKTREKIIAEFHSPNSIFNVLIANPFAVSESISLHKVCHNAIYLERSFNAVHFIQSKDRIHRYGLKDEDRIHYFYILSDNNTDFTIHQRLAQKEKRMMKIIENEPIPLFNRIEAEDDDDIKVLINNYVNKYRST